MTGDELKEIRTGLKLSRRKFADKLGMSESAVEAWEYGVNKISPVTEKAILAVKEEVEKENNGR